MIPFASVYSHCCWQGSSLDECFVCTKCPRYVWGSSLSHLFLLWTTDTLVLPCEISFFFPLFFVIFSQKTSSISFCSVFLLCSLFYGNSFEFCLNYYDSVLNLGLTDFILLYFGFSKCDSFPSHSQSQVQQNWFHLGNVNTLY